MRLLNAIVCNYRTPGDLRRFLDSWEVAQKNFPTTLVIANVCPTPQDDAVALEAERRFEDVVTLEFTENVGYARACNEGALYGNDPLLAFFNADIELSPGSLERCAEALHENPSWAVLGPRQVDRQGRLTHGGIVGSRSSPQHRGWRHRDSGQLRDVVDVPTVSGAAYFIKREVWDQLSRCPLYRDIAPTATGAFLPTQHYYEETYASYHAIEHGWRCVYYGLVTIVHEWHQASPVGGFADAEMAHSREYFRRACDHHGIPHD